MKWQFFISLALLSPAANAAAQDFSLGAPAQAGAPLRLWSTRYYRHITKASSGPDAIDLRDTHGKGLGVALAKKDFCFAALQGTVAVDDGTKTVVYNANGLGPRSYATCEFRGISATSNARLGSQAWAPVTGNGQLGLGVGRRRLVPFRTVAVDKAVIPLGSVLFIPSLRGAKVDVGGQTYTHDGYVLAGDVGSAIKGNHIDLFTGDYRGPPPAFVRSSAAHTFDAFVIRDPAIKDRLEAEARYRP